MGLLKAIKKTARSVVKAVVGDNNKPKIPAPNATIGPAGDMATRDGRKSPLSERKRRQARGRDSTIITSRSELGSKTLLG